MTLVPSAVLAETLDLARYRGGREAAVRVKRELEAFPHFDLDHPVDPRAVAKVWHEHPRLSMHDAHVVALVLATRFEVATFDDAQRTACRT